MRSKLRASTILGAMEGCLKGALGGFWDGLEETEKETVKKAVERKKAYRREGATEEEAWQRTLLDLVFETKRKKKTK